MGRLKRVYPWCYNFFDGGDMICEGPSFLTLMPKSYDQRMIEPLKRMEEGIWLRRDE